MLWGTSAPQAHGPPAPRPSSAAGGAASPRASQAAARHAAAGKRPQSAAAKVGTRPRPPSPVRAATTRRLSTGSKVLDSRRATSEVAAAESESKFLARSSSWIRTLYTNLASASPVMS